MGFQLVFSLTKCSVNEDALPFPLLNCEFPSPLLLSLTTHCYRQSGRAHRRYSAGGVATDGQKLCADSRLGFRRARDASCPRRTTPPATGCGLALLGRHLRLNLDAFSK